LVRLDGLRVLVVDDEPDARQVLVMALEQVGAIVTAAGTAREAIEALAQGRPDVLVSDLGMPDQDGFDLIRQVRDHGHDAKDLPAVALTAFVQQDHARLALLAGFQVHVPKPVDPHDLTSVIAKLAGRTG
jgi:CheY-like chemotaxis protein